MRGNQRILLLVAGVVVLIVGFFVASPGGSDKAVAPAARHFQVVVTGGKPAGGIAQLAADKGDTIDLTVRSDVSDEIHIHGYDIHGDVSAGGTAHFSFRATIDGIFVIELESRAEQIASLKVKA